MLKVKLYHLIANTKLERDICENSDCSLALEHVTGYLVGFPQIYLQIPSVIIFKPRQTSLSDCSILLLVRNSKVVLILLILNEVMVDHTIIVPVFLSDFKSLDDFQMQISTLQIFKIRQDPSLLLCHLTSDFSDHLYTGSTL